jgi:putative ABC transport system permease protein
MPEWKEEILGRLAPLKLAPTREAEIADELSQHLEDRYEELLASGESQDAAFRSALDELKGEELLARSLKPVEKNFYSEPIVPGKASTTLEGTLQDIRYTFRMLRKSPGFTAIAILTLALGIGANSAIFTMTNGLLLRTLPVRDPGRLVELLHHQPGEPEPGFNGFPWHAYEIMRDDNHAFSDLIVAGMNFFTVRGDKLPPQTVFGGAVGGNFFQALGVQPAAGRLIGPEDAHTGYHAPVAVISWSFWKSRFALDPGIIGKRIVINEDPPLTVIGVAQRGFYGLSDEAQQDIWWAASLQAGGGPFGLLARLKSGVSLQQARAEMAVVFQRAVNAPGVGPFVKEMQLRIKPARDGVSTPLSQMLSTPLTVLMATVGLLLLLACANLAGLLLARGASRQHEMAVRVCLGAGRCRLLRQTLTESLLLSLVGGAIGIFLAYLTDRALVGVFKSGRFIAAAPMHFEALTNPDVHVLLFTLAIALLTGLLCGAAPAMSASNTSPASALQQASRIGESKSRRFFGKSLVASQVALSLVLVSSAGLFVGYLAHLRNLNLGFERNNLLLISLDTAHNDYKTARYGPVSEELVAKLVVIPGVQTVTLSGLSPMEGPHVGAFVFTKGDPEKRAEAFINYVAPDYFETYGTPFLAGRDFSTRDDGGSPVAIINEAAARDCFGNEDPIGRHITLNHISLLSIKDERTYEVVGLVGDAKYNDLQQPAPPTIYPDLLQQDFIGSELAIRTRIDPDGVARAVRQTEAAVLKDVPIVRVRTMNEQIDSTIVPQRLIAALSAGFGVLGALLAAIGLYGLLAYTIVRRTHEFGVRIALGAAGSDVMRIVLRDVLWMVCGGLAIGTPLALWGERVAVSLIPGLPFASALPIIFAAGIMIAVGLVAAYIPARRAMRVDPMVALRYE